MAASLPANWWRASTTIVTGGQVDTITDSGSLAKNFGSSGADRCPLGTDADGKTYLDMASDLYTAGALADWKWLHDGTVDWTVAVVTAKPSWPGASGTPLGLLASMSWTTSIGFSLCCGVQGSGGAGTGGGSYWGWETIICSGAAFNLQINTGKPGTPPTSKQVTVVRFCRQRVDVQFSGIGASNPMSNGYGNYGDAWQNGAFAARQNPPPSYTVSVANPANTLALGGFGNGFARYTGRVYEAVTWQRRLPDIEVGQYSQDAASRYTFQL